MSDRTRHTVVETVDSDPDKQQRVALLFVQAIHAAERRRLRRESRRKYSSDIAKALDSVLMEKVEELDQPGSGLVIEIFTRAADEEVGERVDATRSASS